MSTRRTALAALLVVMAATAVNANVRLADAEGATEGYVMHEDIQHPGSQAVPLVEQATYPQQAWMSKLLQPGGQPRRGRIVVVLQAFVLVLTTLGIINQRLAIHLGVSLPMLQALGGYLVMAASNAALMKLQTGRVRLPSNLKGCIAVSFLDVVACLAIVSAYRYTNMASIALLSSLSVIFVMLMSRSLFGETFQRQHIVATIVTILGSALLVLADAEASQASAAASTSVVLWGDCLALIAAVCFASSNVVQELLVNQDEESQELSRSQITSFLMGFGLFGAVGAGLGVVIVGEAAKLSSIAFTPQIVVTASSINIAIQMNSFYSTIWAVVVLSMRPSFLFVLALFLIVGGVYAYLRGESTGNPGGVTTHHQVSSHGSDGVITPAAESDHRPVSVASSRSSPTSPLLSSESVPSSRAAAPVVLLADSPGIVE